MTTNYKEAVHTNRFEIRINSGVVRITFNEEFDHNEIYARASIVMHVEDAQGLVKTLDSILRQYQGIVKQQGH